MKQLSDIYLHIIKSTLHSVWYNISVHPTIIFGRQSYKMLVAHSYKWRLLEIYEVVSLLLGYSLSGGDSGLWPVCEHRWLATDYSWWWYDSNAMIYRCIRCFWWFRCLFKFLILIFDFVKKFISFFYKLEQKNIYKPFHCQQKTVLGYSFTSFG